MKRYLLALLLLALAVPALGAGTVTTAISQIESQMYTVTYTWTADASDGSVPATAGPSITGAVLMVVTDPGSTAPTTLYDITLTDTYSADIMGGTLANRSATVSEQAVPLVGDVNTSRYVNGPLTLNITNNSVNSATGRVIVYVYSLKPGRI